jgi:hypothetical protein
MRQIFVLFVVGSFVLCSVSTLRAGDQGKLTDFEFRSDGKQVQLYFRVVPPRGEVLEIERTASTIETWKDDRGTDIGKTNRSSYYEGATVSSLGWGKKGFVTIYGKHAPSSGARTMTIRGEIEYVAGVDLRKGTARRVKLEKGETIRVGPFDFVVDEVESSKEVLGHDEVEVKEVTFRFDSEGPILSSGLLRKLRVLDEHGNELRARRSNYSASYDGKGVGKNMVRLVVRDRGSKSFHLEWEVFSKTEKHRAKLSHSGRITRTESK